MYALAFATAAPLHAMVLPFAGSDAALPFGISPSPSF
jgi:hypothetical protein